ncbi:MAG: hypothetical protein AAGD22_00565 [Verrucomicrobiota bacterium]
MKRRRFIGVVPLVGIGSLASYAGIAAEGAKAPFRVIYSNDTTHILSCRSPGPERDRPFTDEDLRKSILEAEGVDAHFLQPGLGWIPWWRSSIYSAEDHHAWLRDKHGVKGVTRIGEYLLGGGDMLKTLVATCREIGVAPFLSFRLNDGHHTRDLADALARGRPTTKMARHYWDNYKAFRIGPNMASWDECVFDWGIPEVREYKFALLEEACANYDLAGLELDFLRHWSRFGVSVPLEERREITNGFVARVREMLDRTGRERGLPQRWLSVRVPANSTIRPEQGVDLREMTQAGVDMVNLSYSYFTWQDGNPGQAREEIGDEGSIYVEMTHTTMTGKATAGSGTQPFLRTTDEQFYTTARLAYEQGADGVSLFNFPYYRYHVTESIGPFHEPPFHVLPRLKRRRYLDRQPQWVFASAGRNDSILGDKPLPTILKRGASQLFSLRMIPEKNRPADGLLRLRSDEAIDDREIEVRFNGEVLKSVAAEIHPRSDSYAGTWLGKPSQFACFVLPKSVSLESINEVEVLVSGGIRVRLVYFDLILG